MNRIKVLHDLIAIKKSPQYLEIGVSLGHAYMSVQCKKKIGVDPVNRLNESNFFSGSTDLSLRWTKLCFDLRNRLGLESARFFQLESDEFFSRVPHIFSQSPVNVAFIDGLHTYGQAYRDIQNCLRYLAADGIIVVHDCNPISAAMATPAQSFEEAVHLNSPDWNRLWCGDVWKAIVRLRCQEDLEIFVLDCDMGVGVVRRRKPEHRLMSSAEEVERLSYKDLERGREELLNLKPVSYWKDFLNQLQSELKFKEK